MSAFRDYLQKTYAADPQRIGEFVSNSFVFVRIRQRYWRGYRKAKGVNVAVDGLAITDDPTSAAATSMTMPSWKLAPHELVDEFQLMATGVDQAIRRHAFSPKESADDQTSAGAASAVLVGGGRHMVDVAVWPQLQDFLGGVAAKWSESADRWCTEDGYEKLHANVKEQYGEEIYGKISSLIPERNTMRAKFGLDVRTAPVKIVEEKSTSEAVKDGRRDEIVDLLDLAIRAPREEVADVWEAVAGRLIAADGTALKVYREEAGRGRKETYRTFRSMTIRSVRNHTLMLTRGERYLDSELKSLRDEVLKSFPEDETAAKDVAKALSRDDAEAVRVGDLLRRAATAARNESGMCEGLKVATRVAA